MRVGRDFGAGRRGIMDVRTIKSREIFNIASDAIILPDSRLFSICEVRKRERGGRERETERELTDDFIIAL